MSKPRQFPERELLRLRPAPELAQALERLTRNLCTSTEGAALYALRVGLGLLPIARMPVGEHALVPCENGTVLALSAGPKDAALVEQIITLWSER